MAGQRAWTRGLPGPEGRDPKQESGMFGGRKALSLGGGFDRTDTKF